jgi:predicted CXXCH cytochrome family protein
MKKKWRFIVPLAVLPLIWSTAAFGVNIQFSKHNLSVSGPGEVKAVSESQICIFCHTPHSARQDIPYLWNRRDHTVSYIPYQSSTLFARVGQPTGASKLCLSCHDGTIALGAIVSEPEEIQFQGGIRFIPQGPSRIGTDLSDDHPVSFVYDGNLAQARPGLADPALLPPAIRLDITGQLQCTACHDPHDDTFGNFLVMSNQFSGLCTSCHAIQGWESSSHAISNAHWNGRGTNPWPNTDFQTVAENGCENCHQSHTAPRPARLLKQVLEEDTCLVCHNGNVASSDIASQLIKQYGHFVQDYTGIHDASEDFSQGGVRPHVECEDCHNPHTANSNPSPGVQWIAGANKGVSGKDAAGRWVRKARNLYAICYKCHAQYNKVYPTLNIARQIDQFDTRLEFNLANPSFHPVESRGVNLQVPSLLSPYTVNSLINCTDCHNNDDPMGPKGPHGSSFEYLLERNYITLDFTEENPSTYALCYKCHSRQSILDDQSFAKHKEHIQDEKTPCSACHDPHGISNTQGNPINNSNLINFDLKIVSPDSRGRLQFTDQGTFRGQCFLNCHGKEHSPLRYR